MLPFWDLKDRFDSPCLYQTKHSTIGGQWSLNFLFLLLSLFFVSAIGFITIKKPHLLGRRCLDLIPSAFNFALPENDVWGAEKSHRGLQKEWRFRSLDGNQGKPRENTQKNMVKMDGMMGWWDDVWLRVGGIFFHVSWHLDWDGLHGFFVWIRNLDLGFPFWEPKKIIHIPPQDAFKFLFFPASPFWWDTFTPEQCD